MYEKLEVTGHDGKKFTIYVLDIVEKGEIKEFPDKEYIVYSFIEPKDGTTTKTYFSILVETENRLSLDGIADINEFNIVKNFVLGETPEA